MEKESKDEKKDWKDIHPDFTPELQKEWEDRGFSYEKTKMWIGRVGLKVTEADLAEWLKARYSDVNRSREEYNIPFSTEVFEVIKDFPNYYVYEKKWLSGEPITIGIKENPSLTKIQKLLIDFLIPNRELKWKYKCYGLCQECRQPNTEAHEYKENIWCQSCNAKHFQEEFDKEEWVSGNQKIDEFIKISQLEALRPHMTLEWIPWNKFKVERNAPKEGGFGIVYKAEWPDGYITSWDIEKKEWKRSQDYLGGIALKVFKDSKTSQKVVDNMLREIGYYLPFSTYRIAKCFGISRDPETGNYAIVMAHTGKNLKEYIENNKSLDFKDRMRLLSCVTSGLRSIHNHEPRLVHRDFHAGNILIWDHQDGNTYAYITDLGLCRPEWEKDWGKQYGLPEYFPPELFLNNEYKRPGDVYALGIIAYLIFTSEFPLLKKFFLVQKGKLISGNWLKFQDHDNLPSELMNLIKQCCDDDPTNRPPVALVDEVMVYWSAKIGLLGEYSKEFVSKNFEFYQQLMKWQKEELTQCSQCKREAIKNHCLNLICQEYWERKLRQKNAQL